MYWSLTRSITRGDHSSLTRSNCCSMFIVNPVYTKFLCDSTAIAQLPLPHHREMVLRFTPTVSCTRLKHTAFTTEPTFCSVTSCGDGHWRFHFLRSTRGSLDGCITAWFLLGAGMQSKEASLTRGFFTFADVSHFAHVYKVRATEAMCWLGALGHPFIFFRKVVRGAEHDLGPSLVARVKVLVCVRRLVQGKLM